MSAAMKGAPMQRASSPIDKAKAMRRLVQQVQQLATQGRKAEPDSMTLECSLGDAAVLVEFCIEPSGGDGWNEPHYPTSASCIGVLVNGEWIEPDCISADIVSRWESEALESIAAECDE